MDRKTKDAIGLPRLPRKDMEKAILTANHPKESKFGECLININTKEDHILNSKLNKLQSEMKRMKLHANQLKDHFVRKSQALNYEPMILVERPTSSTHRSDGGDLNISTTEELEDMEKPGYMRRLRRRCKTPANLITIDAFTKRHSKKKNIWEDSDDSKHLLFRSTIRPYNRLTDNEIDSLRHEWTFHKPKYSEDNIGRQTVSRCKRT